MRFIVFATAAVYLFDAFSNGMLTAALGLYPGLVLQGQIWRLVTFIIVPEPYGISGLGPVWFIFAMMFYYSIGSTVEREWGSTKFTLFYACGILLTAAASFVSYGLTRLLWGDFAGIFEMLPFTMGQVNFSLFLVFATLYPDSYIRVYFILPIKAKWLALVYLLLMVFSYMRMSGMMLVMMLPMMLPADLASLINYALFFWSNIRTVFLRTLRRTQHQTSRQTINFKKAAREAQQNKGYLHKCAVCGVTDADNPNMEFRYCSKCNGYYCYCMDHINNHVHIQ
ncbi:MAG: rhomboid family intramembrane serine protease [Clostridia bacterium]|nr:rhomboid family intramembrane serine protease [Clostridia bacterium]